MVATTQRRSGRQSHRECSGRNASGRGKHSPSSQCQWPGCVSWVGVGGANQRQLRGQGGLPPPASPPGSSQAPHDPWLSSYRPCREDPPPRLGFCCSGLPEAGRAYHIRVASGWGPRPPMASPQTRFWSLLLPPTPLGLRFSPVPVSCLREQRAVLAEWTALLSPIPPSTLRNPQVAGLLLVRGVFCNALTYTDSPNQGKRQSLFFYRFTAFSPFPARIFLESISANIFTIHHH